MATLVPSPAIQQDRQTNDLYERDFYSWSIQQADALKSRDLKAIDWENVIEEIADLGKTQQHNWEAFCARVIEHMLKIDYYREATEKVLEHWLQEILDFRQKMAKLIKQNPGLKGQYAEMFAEAWDDGRGYACRRLAEYDRSNTAKEGKAPGKLSKALFERDRTLPAECPYRLEDVTAYNPRRDREPDYDVWPPSVARVLNTRLDADLPGRRARTADSGIGRDR